MRRTISTTMLVVAMLCIALATVARAAEAPASAYTAANAAASRGDHAGAAAAFEKSIVEDGWSVGALLGLANAYANLEQHGRAILALERARLLDPDDNAVLTNLMREREVAAVSTPPVSKLDAAIGRVTSDTWTWLAFGAATLACAGGVVIAWSSRSRLGATLLAGGVLGAAAMGAVALRVAPSPDRAIVLVEEQARIAPIAAAESAFAARPGETVHVEMQRGDHVYVRASDDRAGWLPRSAIEPILPNDRRPSRS